MTSKSMRSFAGGLVAAATLCGIVYFSSPTEATTNNKVEKLSNEEMKDKLSSEGYVIYTEKEWKQLADQADEEKATETEEVKDNKENKVVYRTVLNVSSGMTSIDVGRSLERAKIIDHARTFSNEVEKRGLSNELRPGIYEVESGMNMDKILSVIFPK
ncbi:hypothetical protein V7122_08565 [Bacillus sp. JJ1532]|uniref:hypothetical protein n=1 Tax=unclassified Bacillus (in: firmicutes) TaxID=185979 RepID=UPI002FFF8B40